MSNANQAPNRRVNRPRHRIFERSLKLLNSIAPLLTILVAAVSFLGGILFNAFTERRKVAEAKVEQWRLALEKVDFEERNLLTTAYLMDSFRADSDYHDQARAIEAEALVRAGEPHKFDLMFAIMLRHSSDKDEIDLIRMARTLSIELRGIYAKGPSGNGLKFSEFLMHPEKDYAINSAEYNRTLILLWELDSVSQGFQCSWTDASPDCTHLTPKNQNLHEVLFFNHALPASTFSMIPEGDRPESFETCAVGELNTNNHIPELTCQAPPGR